jgi:hypothetical protein
VAFTNDVRLDICMQVCYSRERSGTAAAGGRVERTRKQGVIDAHVKEKDAARQETECPQMMLFVGSPGALLRAVEASVHHLCICHIPDCQTLC